MNAIRISKRLCVFLISVAIAQATAPVPPTPVDKTTFVGCWKKRYLIQNGQSNADPRWSLKLIFEKNGKFLYDSVSTQEIWLAPIGLGKASARANVTKVQFQGTYEHRGGRAVIKIAGIRSDEQSAAARFNLAYDPLRKEATPELSMQGPSLVAVVKNSGRIFYFERCSD